MDNVKDILDGHIKELLKQNEEMYESRILICKGCEYYEIDKILGARCKQCGCRLRAKTRLPEASCPLSKW